MKKYRLALFLFCVLWSLPAFAGFQDGIWFRSYEAPSEERTALVLPAGQGEWIAFSDSLTLSFSVKIVPDKGNFGYICRIIQDGLEPLDVLFSQQDGKGVIAATADHVRVISIFGEETHLDEWNDLYIRLAEDGNDFVLSANGLEVFRTACNGRKHRIKVCFGKVDVPGYVTTDVAPMILADLRLRVDSRKNLTWPLSDQSGLIPRNGISIRASWPIFVSDINRHWSHWLSTDVPSVTYATFSQDFTKVFFISEGQVLLADVATLRHTVRPFEKNIRISQVLDHFEVLPDGTLVYADPERDRFIRYDAAAGEWEADNDRVRTSTYLHNNSVYLERKGAFLEMFGYGQYHYSNDAWFWSPDSLRARNAVLPDMAPRYLAGAGVYQDKVYVMGGKGNEAGRQELGVRFYDTLLEIDPDSLSVRTCWESPLLQEYVPARDLIFIDNVLYALLYDPQVQDSSLRLWRFDLSDGKAEPLADPIPYRFSDIQSQARLGFDPLREQFIATVCMPGENGAYHADIYFLGYPVMAPDSARKGGLYRWSLLIALAALGLLCAVWFLRRKQETPAPDDVPPAEPDASVPDRPGVFLLGGFHVIDKDGNDIASSFSPILMQLLAILLLHTADKGGVSNAKLKSLLWPDKSDGSFNNNKGVNLSRLRDLLMQVGEFSIVQDGGLWKVDQGQELCDYFPALHALSGDSASDIIRAASRGALLPEYQFDWLDPFKARYTDLVLSRLTALTEKGVPAETTVRIADCRLLFDSLDEEAILQKCQALVSLGRVGTSKAVFERFTEEYKRIMGEDFREDFTAFVKKIQH